MTPREVDVRTFTARMSDEDRRSILEALGSGMGVARFGHMVLTYGRRDAVITTQYPPAQYGSADLGDFVAPPPVPVSKRSPLIDAVGDVPQIRRPPVSPTHTERPSVEFETRVSNHPRSGGFIDARGFAPGREREEVQQPQRELSESEAWWRDRL
jgi:hypothetical protein